MQSCFKSQSAASSESLSAHPVVTVLWLRMEVEMDVSFQVKITPKCLYAGDVAMHRSDIWINPILTEKADSGILTKGWNDLLKSAKHLTRIPRRRYVWVLSTRGRREAE